MKKIYEHNKYINCSKLKCLKSGIKASFTSLCLAKHTEKVPICVKSFCLICSHLLPYSHVRVPCFPLNDEIQASFTLYKFIRRTQYCVLVTPTFYVCRLMYIKYYHNNNSPLIWEAPHYKFAIFALSNCQIPTDGNSLNATSFTLFSSTLHIFNIQQIINDNCCFLCHINY